jgi:pyridoxine 5-phosphate synthase
MIKLSVNINKIATIRNARGGNIPDVIKAAIDCQRFGADGITVHPRPDERHIRYKDVLDLKPVVNTEFNIEGYPSDYFIRLVLDIKPAQVTLVPDPPDALTSNAGWNTKQNRLLLQDVIGKFKEVGIRTSIFIDTEEENILNAPQTGTNRVELYTEPYATDYHKNRDVAIAPFIKTALMAQKMKIGINAGHDLNLDNLEFFAKNIPGLLEVSIGHALISDALYYGLQNTVLMYKAKLG